jgi:hypothetical protein
LGGFGIKRNKKLMDFKGNMWEDVGWLQLACGRIRPWAVVRIVMTLRFPHH